MTHLGTQLSALADGQLGPAETERALAHVAVCSECAAGLAAARSARRTLAEAFEVRPDPTLTHRLLALGASSGEPERPGSRDRRQAHRARGGDGWRHSGAPTTGWDHTSVPLPGTGERPPADCLRGEIGAPRRVPRRVLAAGGIGFCVVATALFVLGTDPVVTPQREPAHALTVLGRAGIAAAAADAGYAGEQGVPSQRGAAGETSGGALGALVSFTPSPAVLTPGGGSSAPAGSASPDEVVQDWLERHPWASEVEIPDGYRLAAVRIDPDGPVGLELDLVGYAGLVVVTQTAGTLDAAAVEGMATEIDGREVVQLSTAPWHLVWQSGDTVVSVVAEVRSPAAESVVASYPAQAYDDGVPARILRGWQDLVGAWNGS